MCGWALNPNFATAPDRSTMRANPAESLLLARHLCPQLPFYVWVRLFERKIAR